MHQATTASVDFLHTPLEQLLVNASALRERGIGGITPLIEIAAQAEPAGLMLGPHFD